MEFDKVRVYTAFNADEVKIGSKGYLADYKKDLISRVQLEAKGYYLTIKSITDDNDHAFIVNSGALYRYFYLVEEPQEPQEPKKRPCTREELLALLKNQRLSMLKLINGKDNYTVDIRSFTDTEITLGNGSCFKGYKGLCENYTLLDGTKLWVEE